MGWMDSFAEQEREKNARERMAKDQAEEIAIESALEAYFEKKHKEENL